MIRNAKKTLVEARMYGRFAWGLRRFLRERISLEEARAIVRRRLETRAESFLRLVERGVFGYARSPYLPLLRQAGCELGDVRGLVRADGLEETLRRLRAAGVYVTFEEFKGRTPIERNGVSLPVEAEDFDNPFLSRCYEVASGGTTGAGKRVMIDLDHLRDRAPALMLADQSRGLLGLPSVIWFEILPGTGLNAILTGARYGAVPQRWFTPIVSRDLRPALKFRLANGAIIALGRIAGVPIPEPELLPPEGAGVIARWAADTLRSHGACAVYAPVSKALRVCLAALEQGLDLTGAVVSGGSEPPTPAKVREITRTGARFVSNYYFTEAGPVGMSCANPLDGNDQHFLKDHLALIQHPRGVPGFGISVDALHFTTLLPTAPKLMLNVETDDYGVVEERACGCLLEACGFTDHLREVRSFRKLTGEGVTLVGSEMLHILEEVLPARFGGTPLDYQLLEEEDEAGFTRLSLVVSPRVEVTDETAILATVLEALGRGSVAADVARAAWDQAGTLRIKRMEPIWTARGKLIPLHLASRAARPAEAGERR